MRERRRLSVAVALSVGAHTVAVALAVGSSLWGAWRVPPLEVEITGMKLEDVTDLPLGSAAASPPPALPPPAEIAPAAPRKAVKKPSPKPAVTAPAEPAPPTPRPQSVRSYGPAGSRVTVLLRVDRLRDTPYTAAVDSLLMRLPDRRDLLEGTDLDLYRDFDAMLVATPNPLDPAVTFLAVRHRLTDAALRQALERGAHATGRTLRWRTERGRPFAERSLTDAGAATATPGQRRDERLILLAAPKLAIVTPPAYRNLLMRGGRPVAPATGAGGAGGAGAASSGAGGAGGSSAPGDEHADWAALVRRIDAEDSILPPNAVVMLSAEDLFGPSRRTRAQVVGATRGAVDDEPAPPAPAPTIFGLPSPRVLTATIGIAPQPFTDVDVTFADEAQATRWESEWPALQQKFRTNPFVVLTGFSTVVARLAVEREGAQLHVHLHLSEPELLRILQLLASTLPMAGG